MELPLCCYSFVIEIHKKIASIINNVQTCIIQRKLQISLNKKINCESKLGLNS